MNIDQKYKIKIVNGTNVKYIDDDVMYNSMKRNKHLMAFAGLPNWYYELDCYVRDFISKYDVNRVIISYYEHDEWKFYSRMTFGI